MAIRLTGLRIPHSSLHRAPTAPQTCTCDPHAVKRTVILR